jgi:HK97 gp10 family phage protein
MSATIEGIPELINKLKMIGGEADKMAKSSVSAIADMIVADAKILAPADLGAIRQGISQVTTSDQNKTLAIVSANAPESAYQEFGTGVKVDVPAEMAEVAASFQGASGGDFAAFILALTGWVKRHGLTGVYSVATHKRNARLSNTDEDEKVAYLIARSILRNGLKPQPFLYPAYVKNSVNLKPMLETALKQYLKAQ